MKIVRALDKFMTKFCSVMLIILSTTMILSAFLQVITRVVFKNSFGWTDELSRYTMVWLALFAGGMAVKESSHVGVNLLRDKLKGPALTILQKFISLITLVFSGILTYYGILLMMKNFKQVTTGLHLSMGMVYGCLPLGGILMFFYSILQLTGLQQKSDSEKDKEESV